MSTLHDDAEHETHGEPTNLTGHAVLDDHHQKVGTVSDVALRRARRAALGRRRPGSAAVREVRARRGRVHDRDGDVVIPYGKDQVKHGPEGQPRPRPRLADGASELEEHYELGSQRRMRRSGAQRRPLRSRA